VQVVQLGMHVLRVVGVGVMGRAARASYRSPAKRSISEFRSEKVRARPVLLQPCS